MTVNQNIAPMPQIGTWVRVVNPLPNRYDGDHYVGQVVPVAADSDNGKVDHSGFPRLYLQPQYLTDAKGDPIEGRVYVYDWENASPPIDHTVVDQSNPVHIAEVFGRAMGRLAYEMDWCEEYERRIRGFAEATFLDPMMADAFYKAASRTRSIEVATVTVSFSTNGSWTDMKGTIRIDIEATIKVHGDATMDNPKFRDAIVEQCHDAYCGHAPNMDWAEADRFWLGCTFDWAKAEVEFA